MQLASLDDVNRVLRYTTGENPTRDAQIRGSLAAVEAWAEGRLKIAREGPGVETYYDVYEDATLRLPAPDCVVTKVKILGWSDSGWFPPNWVDADLGQGYDLTDEGDVILRPTLLHSPFEGAIASRSLRTYDRVEVHYVGTGVVPRDITEGIAWLAAGYWQNGPTALQGMTSEKIGDYSYTIGSSGSAANGGGEPTWHTQAMFFLGPKMRRRRVSVT